MAASFTLRCPLPPPPPGETRRTVLVTGAAGRIGAYFARHASSRYQLRLMVTRRDKRADALASHGEVVAGDLADRDKIAGLCAGMDTVLHLAGDPSPQAAWDSLLSRNIIGVYHVLAGALRAGCRRVILASSIHAVSGYPKDVQVKTGEPVNPGDLYGVSKCFAEALGRYVAEKEGLSVIAIRIGAFQPRDKTRPPSALPLMDSFVSRRDLHQLIERCIDDERLQFAIFHGLSNNRFKRLDITDARELLGYAPEDDFTLENEALAPLDLPAAVQACSVEDSGQAGGIRAHPP